MKDINKVILIGRPTRDPEMRYTPNNTAVASFSIANNYSYGSGDDKKESVSYFDCVAWSKAAEIIVEYGKKGKQILIEGRLTQQRWEDNDGNKKSKVVINIEAFQLLGGKSENNNNEQSSSQTADEDNPFSDENIPF